MVLTTHPALDNDDWVYGTLATSGKSGWLPAAYVLSIENGAWVVELPFLTHTARSMKALYDYSPMSAEELALTSDQVYKVVDDSEADWWKIEQDGRIGLVPAAYLDASSGP